MNDQHRDDALASWQADERSVHTGLAAVDRRAFLMRSAVTGAAAVLAGCAAPTPQQTADNPTPPPAPKAAASQVSADLEVKKKTKGPVMTTIEEFYKVGPGPSSSHTIGPMRITYDFYQRCTKLPADQLAKATALKVHLFGSLSATGKGHGTERAALAGHRRQGAGDGRSGIPRRTGREARPDLPGEARRQDASRSRSKDIIYDAPKGDFPHPNTMTCKLMAGDQVLLEQEYYSVGGGFIEWKGYTPPKKGQPKYPYSTMTELLAHADEEQAVDRPGGDGQRGRGLRQERGGDQRLRRQDHARRWSTSSSPAWRRRRRRCPGPIKLKTKAGEVYKRAMDDKYERQRGVGVVAAYALAGSEENARGHLVVTAPTGGSAGVMPALVYALGEGGRKLPQEKIRDGMLAAAAIGYLCKHNATLSGAEGGCQAEIGVASAMGAAFLAQAHDEPPQVVANAAESSLQHHLGHDLRPGRRLRAGALHRALRVRRGQGLDRLHDRQQRDRRPTAASTSTRRSTRWRSPPRR